jgi:hypothetical protein
LSRRVTGVSCRDWLTRFTAFTNSSNILSIYTILIHQSFIKAGLYDEIRVETSGCRDIDAIDGHSIVYSYR